MTVFQFFHRVGFMPIQDDLERANCPDAGSFGHVTCGICDHGLPLYLCQPCVPIAWKTRNERRERLAEMRAEMLLRVYGASL